MALIRPVTEQEQKIANIQYGKNMEDLSISQRTDIRKRISSGKIDTITFEQYVEDYKGMANDPDYKPKYVKPNLGTGMSPQQLRAKAESRKTIQGFDSKFNKNISRRKRLKLKEALKSDPERKQKEMAKKAERRRTRRSQKLEGKKTLTPREKSLNFQQSLITRQLNDKIKANPNIILQNKELMDKLSITVDGDGNIIKSKPTIYELEKRGLFEIEHQRDVRKAGAMKDFPYNRNPILGPYNRSGGFKDMAEKFIEKNPNSNDPKVKNIIKKAEELKITLQPEVPTGTFKTKGIGYKQSADATGKFIDYAKSTLPELVDDKMGMSGYTGNKEMLEKGLGFKKGAMPEYNSELGAFVNNETPDFKLQDPSKDLTEFAKANPIPEKAIADPSLLKQTIKSTGKLLGGLLSTLGTPAAAAGFAGLTVKGNLDEGKNIADAVVDPMVGAELLFPEVAKRTIASKAPGILSKALTLGRVGSMFTPVGAGITALGIGKELYNVARDQQEMMNNMTEEERLEFDAQQQQISEFGA